MAYGRRNAPSSEAIDGLVPVFSTALETAHILKASPGNLYNLTVNIGAVSGWLMLFDATAVPADGAGQTPSYATPIFSNGTIGFISLEWDTAPVHFVNGIIGVFSTTGPFTKTSSATATFFGNVK